MKMLYTFYLNVILILFIQLCTAGNNADSLKTNTKNELESLLATLNSLGYVPINNQIVHNQDQGTLPLAIYYTLSNNKIPEIINQVSINNYPLTINNFTNDPSIFALSIDPLSSQFPSMSPYNAMGNNPVNYIDPDGKILIAIALLTPYAHAPQDKVDMANIQNLEIQKNQLLGLTIAAVGTTAMGVDMAFLYGPGVVSWAIANPYTATGLAADAAVAGYSMATGEQLPPDMAGAFSFTTQGQFIDEYVNAFGGTAATFSAYSDLTYDLLLKKGIDPAVIMGGLGTNTQQSCQFFSQAVDNYLANLDASKAISEGALDFSAVPGNFSPLLYSNPQEIGPVSIPLQHGGTSGIWDQSGSYAYFNWNVEEVLKTMPENSRGVITAYGASGGHQLNWVIIDSKPLILDAGYHTISSPAESVIKKFPFAVIYRTGSIGDGAGN